MPLYPMTNNEVYVLLFLIIAWLVLCAWASFKVYTPKTPSDSQLKMSLLFIWLIPFFGAALIILFTSKPSKRKVDNKNRYREAGYKSYTRYY